MTNDIIDKVAEAIEQQYRNDPYAYGTTSDYIYTESKSLATAALEALAEQLVWIDLTRCSTLSFFGMEYGEAIEIHPYWVAETPRQNEKFFDREKAKTVVMNEARRVLFGLGPIGGDNG